MIGVRRTAMRVAALLLGLASVAGCARPHETDDERLRRQAAEDARQVRHDAQDAGAVARQEAHKAARQARDIAEGVKQGWQQGSPAPGAKAAAGRSVNVNTASVAELSGLPGISASTARKIVRKRPYGGTDDLVARGLLTEAQYDRISDRLRVHGD